MMLTVFSILQHPNFCCQTLHNTFIKIMDCLRRIFAPCACLCCCCDDRGENLLGGRRTALSVSTHDDDWDAEVGFESDGKARSSTAAKSTAGMAAEMQLQMQQMSRAVTRSMQNVAVTEEDESQNLGASSETRGPSKASFVGYKSSALKTDEEDGFSSGNNSPQISPKGPSGGNGFANRAPYRDTPYSDNKTAKKITGSADKLSDLTGREGVKTESNTNVSVSIDEDGDEEVEISLL